MARPKQIGSLWISEKKKFIHGPRFRQPSKFKRIWVRGLNRSKPRYKMGLSKSDTPLIQSVFRPVYPGEWKYLRKISEWDGRQYIFPKMKIPPYLHFVKKRYQYYSFAFDKKILEKLIRYISRRYNYRTKNLVVNNVTVMRIYIRRKE